MALAGEVGELVEIFQWLTPGESAAVMTQPGQAELDLASWVEPHNNNENRRRLLLEVAKDEPFPPE